MAHIGCFHCGLPVAQPVLWSARIRGSARDFCCAGCAAVANTIAAQGFERYCESAARPGAPARAGDSLPAARVFDDPLAQRHFVAPAGEHALQARLILDGIRCAACCWLIEQALRRLPGVRRVDINYSTRRALVVWDPRETQLSAIIEAVRAVGYDAFPYEAGRQDARERRERRAALWRLFVAGLGAMQVMMYAFPAYLDEGGLSADAEQVMRWASLLLTVPVLLFSCRPFFQGALAELRERRVGLELPIALGIGIGFAASVSATLGGSGPVYFDSIAMLAFLLLGARFVESEVRVRTSRHLDHLLRWMPSYALRLRDPRNAASAERIEAQQLAEGDCVLVPPGERVPADGEVLEGTSSCDESLLTGEARAVRKSSGARLVGGSVNLEQPLVMRVRATGMQTEAAAIARLVERAAADKPRLVQAADRVARGLTLAVVLAAFAAFAWWLPQEPAQAIRVLVAVLVASCPCALALAAPIVLTRASAELLARGVVLTRASRLESLAQASDVVFDKTGTLTAGRLVLESTLPLGRLAPAHCLALARALEAGSRHPLAAAFAAAPDAPAADGLALDLSGLQNHAGDGIEALVEGRRTRIGNRAFCSSLVALPPECPRALSDVTEVYLADEQGWLARFALSDAVREGAAAVVAALRARGLGVHLVSGDVAPPVAALAARLGIDAVRAAATPADKLSYIRQLQARGRVVVMVGDGLNDAPVLAGADASFAMGQGAPAAQQHGDLVLLGAALDAVPEAMALAKKTMRLIRGNFAWAIAYNALVLPLAAAGWIGPWEAAAGMAASSAIVMLNALRPLASRPGAETAQSVAELRAAAT